MPGAGSCKLIAGVAGSLELGAGHSPESNVYVALATLLATPLLTEMASNVWL
jgi:hypothetical protein